MLVGARVGRVLLNHRQRPVPRTGVHAADEPPHITKPLIERVELEAARQLLIAPPSSIWISACPALFDVPPIMADGRRLQRRREEHAVVFDDALVVDSAGLAPRQLKRT